MTGLTQANATGPPRTTAQAGLTIATTTMTLLATIMTPLATSIHGPKGRRITPATDRSTILDGKMTVLHLGNHPGALPRVMEIGGKTKVTNTLKGTAPEATTPPRTVAMTNQVAVGEALGKSLLSFEYY